MLKDYRLSIIKIVVGAILIGFNERKKLWQMIGAPFALLTGYAFLFHVITSKFETVVSNSIIDVGVNLASFALYSIPYVVLFTYISVPCHRMVLLGSDPIQSQNRWRWTRCETRFVVSLVLLILMAHIGVVALNLILALPLSFVVNILPDDQTKSSFVSNFPLVSMVIITYISTRISILFPSIAVGEPMTIDSAWRMSQGNGLQLLVIAALFFYLDLVMQVYISDTNLFFDFIGIALGNIIKVFGVVALSLSYSEIKKLSQV